MRVDAGGRAVVDCFDGEFEGGVLDTGAAEEMG